MSRKEVSDRSLLLPDVRRKMKVAANGLTLEELEQIEEAAHRSSTSDAKSVLRLAAALREALQIKECVSCKQSKEDS